jgi:hypothetical protein
MNQRVKVIEAGYQVLKSLCFYWKYLIGVFSHEKSN